MSSWTGSRLREMLIGWNESQLTWLKEQIEGELTARAWLKRGQRAQPDLAPGSGSPGSLEWSELPDGWRVTVCCRSCEYRMSAKVRPWWESHRHLKLCGWTFERCLSAASVTFEDRLLARDPLLGRCFYQKSLAHAKKRHLAAD